MRELEMLQTNPVANPELEYSFTNFGKTPAFITEMCFQFHIGPRLPDAPAYTNRAPLEGMFVVLAERDTPPIAHTWFSLFNQYFVQQDFEPIRRRQSGLFIYGFMEYSDVFDVPIWSVLLLLSAR